jgi:hypothetical protein
MLSLDGELETENSASLILAQTVMLNDSKPCADENEANYTVHTTYTMAMHFFGE